MIAHISDHVERAMAYVPGYHRAKAGIKAAVTAILGLPAQELEDLIYDAASGETFRLARGAALTRHGEMWGVQREGLEDDAWYRRLIVGTARARRCTGTEDEMINLWKGFTDTDDVEADILPLDGLQLVAWRDTYMPPDYAKRAAAIMRAHSPAAGLVLIEALNVNYLGGSARTSPPYGSRDARGIPARVH